VSVARVTEISAISPESFEAATREAIISFTTQFRGVREAWVKEQKVLIGEDNSVAGYQVNMAFTFVREEPAS